MTTLAKHGASPVLHTSYQNESIPKQAMYSILET